MAKATESQIERRLGQIVKAAFQKGEQITTRLARSQVEKELDLRAGFLTDDAKWRSKSKAIIQAAVEESDEPEQAGKTETTRAAQSKEEEVRTPVTPKSVPQKKSSETVKASGISRGSVRPAQQRAGERNHLGGNAGQQDESESSRSEESEEEDDENESSPVGKRKPSTPPKASKTAPPTVNGVKRKAHDETTAESESEGEDLDIPDEPQRKKSRTNAPIEAEDREEGISGDNSTEAPFQNTSTAILPTSFTAPPGYTLLDSTQLGTNSALTPAQLDGAQIWHIIAPSNLPLSSITDFSLSAITSGATIVSHNNTDYTLQENLINEPATIFLPSAEGYQQTSHPISRNLAFQQKITLPNLSTRQANQNTGSSAAAEIGIASVSAVRPQPKGLRMRYKPPGFGAGDPGRIGSGSDSEDDESGKTQAPTFQFPRTLGAHGTATQKDNVAAMTGADTLAEDSGSKTKKKEKKKRREKDSAASAGPISNAVLTPLHTSQLTPVSVKLTATAVLPNGPVGGTRSKEDKARRKEEKRVRKEARRVNREARKRAQEAGAP